MEVNINGKDYEVVCVCSQESVDKSLIDDSPFVSQNVPHYFQEHNAIKIAGKMLQEGAIKTKETIRDGVVTFKAKAYVLLPKQDANRLHQTPQE